MLRELNINHCSMPDGAVRQRAGEVADVGLFNGFTLAVVMEELPCTCLADFYGSR
jgi:hypothetical protein